MVVIFDRCAVEGRSALYRSAATGAPGCTSSYFLLLEAQESAGPPARLAGLQAAWSRPGVFVFAGTPVTLAPRALARQLGLEPPFSTELRGLAWVSDGASGQLEGLLLAFANGQTRRGSIPFGDLELSIPNAAQISVDDVAIKVISSDILLWRSTGYGPSPLTPSRDEIAVGFDPAAAGAVGFEADWRAWDLYSLFEELDNADNARGAELRYFSPRGPDYLQLTYPVAPVASLASVTNPTLMLDAALDPLHPTDGARSRLLFRAGTPASALSAGYARTTAGAPITLIPVIDEEPAAELADGRQAGPAGLCFGAAPPLRGPAHHLYLSPVGSYRILSPSDGPLKMMCGTSGLEFLQVGEGDIVDFISGQPAMAPGFGTGPSSSGEGRQPEPLLTGPYTTSWITLHPEGPEGRGYYAQPNTSVSFALGAVPAQAGGTMSLPAAVSAQVWAPGPSAYGDAARSPAFPMALYGAALTRDRPPTADTLSDFESQVLTVVRGAVLREAPSATVGPTAADSPPPPVFTDARGKALPGDRTVTPQGLLVELNSGPDRPGTWRRLVLARHDGQDLAVNAPSPGGTVDPWLASTLLREQGFLVLNRWDLLPHVGDHPVLERTIQVGGFRFEIAPDPDDPAVADTILVAKRSTTRPLTDLVESTGAWDDRAHFVGDEAAVSHAQQALRDAIATAEAPAPPGDPFAHFRDVVAKDPGWTGIVVINAPINGSNMPADLQMLLAGIEGRLKAHHVGSEWNRIVRDQDGRPDIAQSSMLGVVHYRGEPGVGHDTDAYSYQVEQLDVSIVNSRVRSFEAQVGVTINELFGRTVALDHPDPARPNTISIKGRYQREGEVGTITFSATEDSVFRFNPDGALVRVTDAFRLARASLAPQSSAKDETGGATTIKVRFTFAGSLSFAADPFPGLHTADRMDLFSYGSTDAPGARGLPLANLGLAITAVLDADGARIGPAVITPDLSAVTAVDDAAGLRRGSLLSRLPFTVDGFVHDPNGLDTSSLKGRPVNILPLTSVQASIPAIPGRPGPPAEGEPEPFPAPAARSIGYTSSQPLYGIRLRLPMGSVGALADVHASLDAAMTLAWGPSTATPDDDGVSLTIQLPELGAGMFGMNLEGLLKTTFGDANLARVDDTYVVLFNNVAVSLIGITLPPKVISDFVVFAGADGGELGWSLAATQVSRGGA